MGKILAIDDDKYFLKSLSNLLEYKEYTVELIDSPSKAEIEFNNKDYDCVLMDVKMPGITGLDLLNTFQRTNPSIPIIMISGESHIEEAVLAIQNGAFDFIEKPLDADRLLIAIKNALERKSSIVERNELLSSLNETYNMIGESVPFKEMLKQIELVADTNAKILILGESGVGKELVARALHYNSSRSGKPFIKINCAAIPGELLESELFGHKKGSFTGALSDYDGKFVQANNGTLFLDEIGDMDSRLQSKLLRVLQDEEINAIGGSKIQKVDVRIICASNKDLKQMVELGNFREDLYHRINVVKIEVVPLRERKDDIPVLARYYLHQLCEVYNKKIFDFDANSISILVNYNWPGNVRELKNIVERIVIFTKNSIIHANDIFLAMEILPKHNLDENHYNSLHEARENFEKEFILQKLRECEFKIIETAKSLGINRSALFKKMKKYDIKKI